MASQPAYSAETAVLRRVATSPDCRWIWTGHALEQMAKRGIRAADVKHALTTGQVVLHEWAKKDVLWRVEGKDADGSRIGVSVAVFEEAIQIKVISAF